MTQAASGAKLRRKDLYYFDLVVFQVEDALFKVPKNHFTTSSVFATIFTLPSGENDAEGTEDKPFILHGISEVDFESLLKLMYPPPLSNIKLTRQDWISVLKLCTMWEFTDMRERAIQELLKEDMSMGTIDKIECGKRYQVKEMLLEGYNELLKRAETITAKEAERLGWKTAAKLLLLREEYLSTTITSQHPSISETCGQCGRQCGGTRLHRYCDDYGDYYPYDQQVTRPDRNQHDFTQAIQKEFEEEL